MAEKRSASNQPNNHFSCELCYRRKLKCDRGNPCTHCVRQKIDCVPSPVEISGRPRKKRYPEAELLARIKRYEKKLLSCGVDLENINSDESAAASPVPDLTPQRRKEGTVEPPVLTDKTVHPAKHLQRGSNEPSEEKDEFVNFLNIIDGEGRTQDDDSRGQRLIYDRFYGIDGSSLLFAIETSDIPSHPAPFDIFKLWQIYCDNVHPLCKILHGPTFQRKISSYGSQLHFAAAADQALFFAMYVAAISTLSTEECEASFFVTKEALLNSYQLAAQVWLRKSGFWRTSEVTVLQAFVLFLYTQQHVIDPRALTTFTGMADRTARRMGLHRDNSSQKGSLVEQEIKKRIWWELVFLDARTSEKAGMGNITLTGPWTTSLPSAHSDADLECLQKHTHPQAVQPSSDMIFLLVRSEIARLAASLRCHQSNMTLPQKIKSIEELEGNLQSQYWRFCSDSLPQHRMATIFGTILVARLRISVYLVEEASTSGQQQKSIRLKLLEECSRNLECFTTLRGDPALRRFTWFLVQYMPIFPYIHLLRLLQSEVRGQLVARAWQAVEGFKSQGVMMPVDSLVRRAWKAREAASDLPLQRTPSIQAAFQALVEEMPTIESSGNSHYAKDAGAPPSNSDYMVMLAEIMTGNTDYNFDWSTWLNESPSQTGPPS